MGDARDLELKLRWEAERINMLQEIEAMGLTRHVVDDEKFDHRLSISDQDLKGLKFGGYYWLPLSLERVNLEEAEILWNAPDSVLSNGKVADSTFYKARLDRSKITESEFVGCSFNKAEMGNTEIVRTKFVDCSFLKTYFIRSDINSVTFERCTFSRTIFSETTLTNVSLVDPIFEMPSLADDLTVVGGNYKSYLNQLRQGTTPPPVPPGKPN